MCYKYFPGLLLFLDFIVLYLSPGLLQSSVLSPEEAATEAPNAPERAESQPQPPSSPVQEVPPCEDWDADKGPPVASQTPAIPAQSSTQAQSTQSEARN